MNNITEPEQARLQVDIVSAEELIFSNQALRVFITGQMGELGLAFGHSPLITLVRPGYVRVDRPGKQEVFYISGGMLEVQPSSVTVLADTILRASDVDEAAAIKAKERAVKALASKSSGLDIDKAKSELAYATAQLRAIKELRDLK